MDVKIAEQIAYDLQIHLGSELSPHEDFAWVTHENKTYYCRFPKDVLGPSSATVKLIQFVFAQYVDHSFFILRNPIYSTATLSPMCEGMVQLAAKQATGEIQAVDHGISLVHTLVEIGNFREHFLQPNHLEGIDWQPPVYVFDALEAHYFLDTLISRIPRDEAHLLKQPIAALVCDRNGKLLSWSVDNNSKNKTLHAEILAVQKYFEVHKSKLPVGARIYISLKPCRMCAAMIAQMSEDPQFLEVVYFKDDPGPLAQNTVLDNSKVLKHYLLQDESPTA